MHREEEEMEMARRRQQLDGEHQTQTNPVLIAADAAMAT
jgi:hypothetical protein